MSKQQLFFFHLKCIQDKANVCCTSRFLIKGFHAVRSFGIILSENEIVINWQKSLILDIDFDFMLDPLKGS